PRPSCPRSAPPLPSWLAAARKFTALAYRQWCPHNALVLDRDFKPGARVRRLSGIGGHVLFGAERAGVAAFFLVLVVLRRVDGGAARRSASNSAARWSLMAATSSP